MTDADLNRRARVCIVGPSPQLTSGVTYYVHGLAQAISSRVALSLVYLGRVRPFALYEDLSRVEVPADELATPAGVETFDSVDWTVIPNLANALRFLRQRKPDVLVLVCWTPWTLAIYLTLAIYARASGMRVVVDLHRPAARHERMYKDQIAQRSLQALVRLADQVAVHDEFARGMIMGRFGLPSHKVTNVNDPLPGRHTVDQSGTRTFLFFGGIDEFKGVADLVHAFDAFSDSVIDRFRLVIAGPVHGDMPIEELVATSRHAKQIRLDPRWIPEDEVAGLFDAADVVVLPYRQTWSTGPLDLAMRFRKQVVLTRIEGFATEAKGYTKRTLAEAENISSLAVAMERAAWLAGDAIDPHRDWATFEHDYTDLLEVTSRNGARMRAS
ncbi:MAG: putative glycosyltransferase [Actinomycetia bacterium]|nr:putative glycosyltransferase [Actinomycetes bacterium]